MNLHLNCLDGRWTLRSLGRSHSWDNNGGLVDPLLCDAYFARTQVKVVITYPAVRLNGGEVCIGYQPDLAVSCIQPEREREANSYY